MSGNGFAFKDLPSEGHGFSQPACIAHDKRFDSEFSTRVCNTDIATYDYILCMINIVITDYSDFVLFSLQLVLLATALLSLRHGGEFDGIISYNINTELGIYVATRTN